MTVRDQASAVPGTTSQKLPAGFQYSGVACGIKESGLPDLALIVADRAVVAAGVYTQNQVVAPPVVVCRSRTPANSIRAVVTNSGNANACTGDRGMRNANDMCRFVADQVGCEPEQVLVMSTGVIGQQLPMKCIRSGIDQSFRDLGKGQADFDRCAAAICTTDQSSKTAVRSLEIGGKEYAVAAMAKGAGMIAPNMATLLSVILTDAPLSPEIAQRVVAVAGDASFNRISVDGHTSTNDTLLLLSSGSGDLLRDDALDQFQQHVNELSIGLAKMIVADGEGASHVIALRVTGADDDAAAHEIAKTVAASPLVKTAVTGADPNWGRIVSAAGYATASIDPHRTSLRICGVLIYENGAPTEFDEKELSKKMQASHEVDVELQVGSGTGEADFWASDLTTDYVRFNSEYTT